MARWSGSWHAGVGLHFHVLGAPGGARILGVFLHRMFAKGWMQWNTLRSCGHLSFKTTTKNGFLVTHSLILNIPCWSHQSNKLIMCVRAHTMQGGLKFIQQTATGEHLQPLRSPLRCSVRISGHAHMQRCSTHRRSKGLQKEHVTLGKGIFVPGNLRLGSRSAGPTQHRHGSNSFVLQHVLQRSQAVKFPLFTSL